jgi:L-threonylcarbamoyladenylate synthase
MLHSIRGIARTMNRLDPLSDSCRQEVDQAVDQLRRGKVVAFPTDTLYGLGADVFDEPALRRLFAIKGRPADLALPVLAADWAQVEMVAGGRSETARRLAERFWPGSLTLVLPKAPQLSELVTGGRNTVAARIPGHWVPQELSALLGRPITGTSANYSGGPDLLTLEEIELQLGHLVDYIVRCGPVPQGVPSTVVDVTAGKPRLLREGAIPFNEILRACQ